MLTLSEASTFCNSIMLSLLHLTAQLCAICFQFPSSCHTFVLFQCTKRRAVRRAAADERREEKRTRKEKNPHHKVNICHLQANKSRLSQQNKTGDFSTGWMCSVLSFIFILAILPHFAAVLFPIPSLSPELHYIFCTGSYRRYWVSLTPLSRRREWEQNATYTLAIS